MVKSAENSAFNYELKQINNLINKLDIRFFERPAILNFDLLNYLIDNQQEDTTKLDRFFKQLSNEKKRTYEFINAYIEFEAKNEKFHDEDGFLFEKNNVESFINLLCGNWTRYWDYIYLESNYSEVKTKNHIRYIVQYANIEDIVLLNYNSNINNYIMQRPEFLTLFEKTYHNKVKSVISTLNIKFEQLGYKTDETKELHDFVYKNRYYKINLDNISVILESYHKDTKVSGHGGTLPEIFETKNYETVLNSDCNHLLEYLNEFFNEYVKKAYLKIDVDNEEKENILTEYFLNNDSLNSDLKIRIINKTKTIFNNLSKVVNIETKRTLIQLNKIEPNWDNIYSYLINLENTYIDSDLINFYNDEKNYKVLGEKVIETNDEDLSEFYRSMCFAIIKCNELSIESYSNLINSINPSYKRLNFEHLSKDKVYILIDKNKLLLTKNNYTKLRDDFSNLHIYLIEKHQKVFTDNVNKFILDEEDFTMILESGKVNDYNKIKILKHITSEEITNSKELSKAILHIVLKNKYLSLDLIKINDLLSHNLSTESKVNLITLYGSNGLSKDSIIELITSLPSRYQNISTKTQTTIPKNDSNEHFIKALKIKGIISTTKKTKSGDFRLWMKKL